MMTLRAVTIVMGLLISVPCAAGNDDEILVGNDAALMGGAVTAVVNDGSSVWYNPAGIAGVAVDTLNVSGSAFILRSHRVPRLLSSASGPSVPGEVLEFVSVPSALTYVRPLSSTVRIALGVFVTQATDQTLETILELPKVSPELPVPGRVLLALDYSAQTYHAGLSVGWKVLPKLWVGASLMASLEQTDGSTLYSGGTVDSSEGSSALFNQSQLYKTTNLGLLVNAGAQWQVTPQLRLGLSVQSQSYAVFNSFSAPSVRAGVVSTEQLSVFSFGVADSEGSSVGFEAYAPPRVRLGAAYTGRKLTVVVDGDVRPGNRAGRKTNYNARVGARYAFSEDIAVGAGAFTDRSPVRLTDAFGARDIDFYGATLGLNYVTALALRRKVGADKVTFSTTVALRYAYGRGQIGGLVVPTVADDLTALRSTPTRLTTHEVGVHLGSSVFF